MNAMQQAFKAAKIEHGVMCPYCGGKSALVGGNVIYPHRPDLHMLKFWQCAPCDAYVGCHKPNPRMGFDGTQPLGRLANAELRQAKSEAHDSFDWIWQDGHMKRKAAYAWLAKELGIPVERCHIGEFDVDMCQRVEDACDRWFQQHMSSNG